MMVDGVVETPNGAHFTTCTPDYERDEAFQKALRHGGRRRRRTGRRSSERFLSGDEAAYQAAVARVRTRRQRMTDVTRAEYCAVAIADAFADDGEILASPMGLLPMLGARLAKLTSNPDLLLTDGEALFLRRRPAAGRQAATSSRAGSRSAGSSTSSPTASGT